MISVNLARNCKGQICGFTVDSHGPGEVCAAVSMLAINTVNSIEALTNEPYACDYDEAGGFLRCVLPKMEEGRKSRDAGLLLESMVLGMRSVKEQYPDEIKLDETVLDEVNTAEPGKAESKSSKGKKGKKEDADA